MKFGGTSVGDTQKIKDVARRLATAREAGQRVVGVLSAMGHTTDELIRLAQEISPRPQRARVRHARLHRRAHLERALRDGDPRPRPRGGVAHRLAGRHRHRHGARQGEDRRGARTAHQRGARRRQDRARRRLPGRLVRERGDDARPRRLRHDRGRARRGARRAVCEIYTDVEGVFTADPRIVPDARKLPRVDATRRCSRWRRAAPG